MCARTRDWLKPGNSIHVSTCPPAPPPGKKAIDAGLARGSRASGLSSMLGGFCILAPTIDTRPLGMSTKAKPTPAKPAVNISALARHHRVSRESLRQWRRDGVDLSNPAQLADRIARMHTLGNASEALKRERLRKLKADATLAELELAKRRGDVIDAAIVAELFQSLTIAAIAQLKRLPCELPGMLEGMDPAAMQAALADFRDEAIVAVRAAVEGTFQRLEQKLPKESVE